MGKRRPVPAERNNALEEELEASRALLHTAAQLLVATSDGHSWLGEAVPTVEHPRFVGLFQPGALEAMDDERLDVQGYVDTMSDILGCEACYPAAIQRLIAGLRFAAAHFEDVLREGFVEVHEEGFWLEQGYWLWMSRAPFHGENIPALRHFRDFAGSLRDTPEEDIQWLDSKWSRGSRGTSCDDGIDFEAILVESDDYDDEEFEDDEDGLEVDALCMDVWIDPSDALDPRSKNFQMAMTKTDASLLHAIAIFNAGLTTAQQHKATTPELLERALRWIRSDGTLNEALIKIDLSLAVRHAKVPIPSAAEMLKRIRSLVATYKWVPVD